MTSENNDIIDAEDIVEVEEEARPRTTIVRADDGEIRERRTVIQTDEGEVWATALSAEDREQDSLRESWGQRSVTRTMAGGGSESAFAALDHGSMHDRGACPICRTLQRLVDGDV